MTVARKLTVHPLGQDIPQEIPYEKRLVLLHNYTLDENGNERNTENDDWLFRERGSRGLFVGARTAEVRATIRVSC